MCNLGVSGRMLNHSRKADYCRLARCRLAVFRGAGLVAFAVRELDFEDLLATALLVPLFAATATLGRASCMATGIRTKLPIFGSASVWFAASIELGVTLYCLAIEVMVSP